MPTNSVGGSASGADLRRALRGYRQISCRECLATGYVVHREHVQAANVQPDTHRSATAAKAAAQLSEIRFGGCGSGGMPWSRRAWTTSASEDWQARGAETIARGPRILPVPQYALHATATAPHTFQTQPQHFFGTRCVSVKTADCTEVVTAPGSSFTRSLDRTDAGNETANVNTSTEISRTGICMAPQYQSRRTRCHRFVNPNRTDQRMLQRTLPAQGAKLSTGYVAFCQSETNRARWRGDSPFPVSPSPVAINIAA